MTIFASLYISYTRLMYFATESLYLLIFITYFSTLPTPIPTGNHLFVLCIYDTVSVFLCFFTCFIDSTYRWNHAALVFPWLISLSIMPSRSTHVVKWQDFILCLWLSNIHIHTHIHTHTLHRLHSFVYWLHLACFRILAIIKTAAMNTVMHISFLISVFVFFG